MEGLMLYLLAAGFGYVLAKLFQKPVTSPFFEDVIMRNIKLGKKVIIAIDNDATIFEMVENRLRITRGTSEYTDKPFVETVENETLQ